MNTLILIISMALCFIIFCVCVTISPFTDITKQWCETKKHNSNNKKEIEFRRLEVLEKTPELRELIFKPKKIEE